MRRPTGRHGSDAWPRHQRDPGLTLPFSTPTLFVAFSTGFVLISRHALQHPGSHGFFRFFAAEFTLLVALMNREPVGDHTIPQILLIVSAALAFFGFLDLRRFGKPDRGRTDRTLLSFERTTELVTQGIYRHIRHPMYASVIALGWAFFFRDPSWTAALLVAIATFFFHLTARADELECLAYFGEPYADYMTRTRRFVPYVI